MKSILTPSQRPIQHLLRRQHNPINISSMVGRMNFLPRLVPPKETFESQPVVRTVLTINFPCFFAPFFTDVEISWKKLNGMRNSMGSAWKRRPESRGWIGSGFRICTECGMNL